MQQLKTNRFKFTFNESKIDINNPIFCYYVGLVSTDGYISVKTKRVIIRLRNQDAERLLFKLKEYFEYTGPIFKYRKKDFELRMSSVYLIKYLENLGISYNKTQNLSFLQNFTSEECNRMYIRGLHDGDGNIKRTKSKRTNRWVGGAFRILNNNELFIEDFSKWLNNKFTINSKIYTAKRKTKNFKELYTSSRDGKDFAKWFYKGFNEIKLYCKYSKYITVRDNDIVQTIENKNL